MASTRRSATSCRSRSWRPDSQRASAPVGERPCRRASPPCAWRRRRTPAPARSRRALARPRRPACWPRLPRRASGAGSGRAGSGCRAEAAPILPAARIVPDAFFVTPSVAEPPARRPAPLPEPTLSLGGGGGRRRRRPRPAISPPRRLPRASDDFLLCRPARRMRPIRCSRSSLRSIRYRRRCRGAGTAGNAFGASVARTSPFLSDALMADLSEPAYTRKYLD